jgi:hypothetical protein
MSDNNNNALASGRFYCINTCPTIGFSKRGSTLYNLDFIRLPCLRQVQQPFFSECQPPTLELTTEYIILAKEKRTIKAWFPFFEPNKAA